MHLSEKQIMSCLLLCCSLAPLDMTLAARNASHLPLNEQCSNLWPFWESKGGLLGSS